MWVPGTTTGAEMADDYNALDSDFAALLAGFSESVDDRVAVLLQAGANISITYNDALGTLTIAATGGGGLSDGDYGDVAVSGSGTALTIDADVVSNTKLANMPANTIKGNNTGSTADPADLTGAQVAALLPVATNTAAGLAAAPDGGPDRCAIFNDCLTAVNGPDISFSVTGTGAAHSSLTPQDGGIGWIRGVSGTTATGRTAIVSSSQAAVRFSLGRAISRNRFRVGKLSTGTETFSMRSGFIDLPGGESTDGAFFRYTHSVNGGRWEAVCRSNNVETGSVVDTGITVATATTYIMEVDVNAGGTSVEFRINGSVVATITSNIPTASGRETGFGLMALKSAGLTSVTFYDCDYVAFEQRFTGR